MNVPILFEDQDLVLINKPPGVVVNKAETHSEETIQEWCQQNYPLDLNDASWAALVPPDFDDAWGSPIAVYQERSGIVHRLDKDTSGVMVLAKNPGSLVNLLDQFKKRRVKKEYLCLVHGKVIPPKGTISAPLGRAHLDRKKFAVVPDGRPAVTHYQVQNFFPQVQALQIVRDQKAAAAHQDREFEFRNFQKKSRIYQGFSLVTCQPETGRTHQIRVHMASLQHPLVGDQTYSGKKRQKLDLAWCPRQFLHASWLEFTHPRLGTDFRVEAPLAEDLSRTLAYLSE